MSAVDPATPSPRFLIFALFVEILFLFVVTWGIVPDGVTSTPSINNLLPLVTLILIALPFSSWA